MITDGGSGSTDDASTSDSGLPLSLKALGTVVGSTTAVAALLFYFGWSRAYYFYEYFGVDSSVLNLSTRDYVQLSVDGLFVPLIVIACGALALLWARAGVVRRIAKSRRLRALALIEGIVGGLLLINGLSRIVVSTPLNSFLAVAPLSLAIGVCLIFSGVRLYRRTRPDAVVAPAWVSAGEWAALFTLLGMALFWIANDYSAEVGQTRARQFQTELPALPATQVFATKSLGITAPGVHETRCTRPDAAYLYRYDGLKLVLQSGDVYLLLPARWSRRDGVAIVLPRNDSTRLQFSPPRIRTPATPPC